MDHPLPTAVADGSELALPLSQPAPQPGTDIFEPVAETVAMLRKAHSLTFTGATVLAGILSRDPSLDGDALLRWLDPKLTHLTVPHEMADRGVAIDRIARAVRAGETIAVFGDYDCDGITSTAILTQILRALGGTVAPFLATRNDGAYGLSQKAVTRILTSNPTLLVTCDCGSSDHERIAFLRDRGVDTIVIDHHLVPAEELPALAFLNPHRPICEFPFKYLASCGLALTLGAGLRLSLGKELDLRRYLDLVAIGTVADVAPLTQDNRALVHAGLRVLSRGGRPGLRALAEVARLDLSSSLTSEDIAFRIAPRLNAPGRLGDPDDALALLLTEDATTAQGLASSVEQTQLRRRAVQEEMLGEALADISERGLRERAGIVLARQGWHPGVVGIVAGKVAESTGRPTVVIGLEGATGRGSVRGPSGFPLHDALVLCRADLVGFGGHQAAAGVHVLATGVDAFATSFDAACASLADAARPSRQTVNVRLDARDDLEDVLADLERFEPYGEGNPAPRLVLDGVTVKHARNLKGHLKLTLEYGGTTFSAVYFGRGHHAVTVIGQKVQIFGVPRRNTYAGGVEIHVQRTAPVWAEL